MAFDMGDYVEVADRLRDLFAKHPFASLRGSYEIVEVGGETFVAYRAECYRGDEDKHPGVGCAWEPVPGKTPYTKGSELQNAETSAWGRAIVAVGASESKKIASANEVRNARTRNAEVNAQVRAEPVAATQPSAASAPTASKNRVQQLQSKLIAMQQDGFRVASHRKRLDLPPLNDECTDEELETWTALLNEQDGNLQRENVA